MSCAMCVLYCTYGVHGWDVWVVGVDSWVPRGPTQGAVGNAALRVPANGCLFAPTQNPNMWTRFREKSQNFDLISEYLALLTSTPVTPYPPPLGPDF